MTKNFHSSFKQDLAKIINRYNGLVGGPLSGFGTKLAEAMAEEVEQVCTHIDTIKTKPNLIPLLPTSTQKLKYSLGFMLIMDIIIVMIYSLSTYFIQRELSQ